ncbi:MAG: ATP-binding protein [Verrucomicrobiota bacterium]
MSSNPPGGLPSPCGGAAGSDAEQLFLRAMLDSSPDHIYFKDTQSRFLCISRALAHYFGLSDPSEALGKTDFDFHSPEKAGIRFQDERRIMETMTPIVDKIELQASRTDGTPVWVLTSKSPLCDGQGRLVGTFGISRDITELHDAQEALEKANADLRQSRENLLHTLEELRSVQLQLVEAEKMKLVGRLAAGVAHEVKNPLAIISMGLEYLNSQKSDDPNLPVVLAEIDNAVQRADRVVRELLDFSAPKKMNRAPEDVNRLVRNALVLVRGELLPRKVAVVEELTADLPLARLDAMKIEQVLVNLFSNAAQAMETGGRLIVRTASRQVTGIGENIAHSDRFRPGDRLVSIEILDTGPGIPEADLGKVFEPFFTTKPTGKGSGLGLTVTKTIVDLHGGEIEIENRPEGGVHVTLLFNVDTD